MIVITMLAGAQMGQKQEKCRIFVVQFSPPKFTKIFSAKMLYKQRKTAEKLVIFGGFWLNVAKMIFREALRCKEFFER